MMPDLVAFVRSWLMPARATGQREPPSIAQVLKAFEGEAAWQFTNAAGSIYSWELSPAFPCAGWGLDNITVLAAGSPIAWIQEITLDVPCHCAKIGHFAIDPRYAGHGLGRLLAKTLRAELHVRLGVVDIVFAERSTRFVEAGYEAFFRSLGATETTRPGWRSEWLWRGEP